MVALGFALPNWEHLVVACAGINVAALLLYPLVTESARWLLSKGRTEDATKALKRIARFNKSRLPTQPMVVSKSRSQISPQRAAEEGRAAAGSSSSSNKASEAPVRVWQLLKRPQFAMRLGVLLLNWFSLMLNYYGISMGAGGIPGSM